MERRAAIFLYVTDVARAFYAAALTDRTGQIYNLGAGDPQPVNRLAELLGGERVYIPKRPGEPDCNLGEHHADSHGTWAGAAGEL